MPLHTHPMFHALPPYFGGKRRLLGEIFRYLPSPAEAPVLADCFLGGGSVSLYAKARGYQVLCNDIAMRSYIVGKALIENDSITLSKEDGVRLFASQTTNTHFIEEHFCPDVLTRKHAQFLDNAFAVARRIEGERRWLLLLLLIKYIFRMRPMGNFGAKSVVHQMEEERWDEMNEAFLRDCLTRKIHGHPVESVEVLREQINRGVRSNARMNMAHQLDVFEFLPQIEADIGFFDPPYAGTMAYESALKVVDQILAGEVTEVRRSAFSGPEAMAFVERMFEAARHIPIWAVTYGNAVVGLDEIVALVGKFKKQVTAVELAYIHCSGLAGEESRTKNRELIIIGRN